MTQPPTEASIVRVKDGPWDTGVAGTCECGWVGPKRDRYGICLIDINEHNTTHAAARRVEEVAP